MDAEQRAKIIAKRIADAWSLEESVGHRETWGSLVYNVLNGPAVWPDGWRVRTNQYGLQLTMSFDDDGMCLVHWWMSPLSRPWFDTRDRDLFKQADNALDGMLTYGLTNLAKRPIFGTYPDHMNETKALLAWLQAS